ncbi:MAG: hypothetical protein WCP45_14690 [Verrucomicrobiota bacterium]
MEIHTYSSDPAATPKLVYIRDTLGRIKTVTRAGILHATYTYDPTTLRLVTENLNQDTAAARTLNRYYDALGRPLSIKVGTEYTTAIGFDIAGRLNCVWDHPALDGNQAPIGAAAFNYGYQGSSYTLVSSVTGPAHTVTNHWESARDVLLSKTNSPANPAQSVVSSFNYDIPDAANSNAPSGLGANSIGQRKSLVATGSAFTAYPAWSWGYDLSGELTSAANATTPDNSRFYQFDDIGNRKLSRTATNTNSGGAVTSYYASTAATTTGANAINQYGKIAFPGGDAVPAFDADGNMKSGPVLPRGATTPVSRVFVWDAENRLVEVMNAAGDTTIATYIYDHLSRRIGKTTASAAPQGISDTTYLYDGWNLIAEYSGATIKKTYVYGMDLSGSMQGAGGVGGLLSVTDEVTSGHPSYYPTYDGNGNVSEYLDGGGNVVAHYEYDPFGKDITPAPPVGVTYINFAHRFSTKYFDAETGLYYYGYRYYDPLRKINQIHLIFCIYFF